MPPIRSNQLLEDDAMTATTNGINMRKKDKIKLRRELWLKKFEPETKQSRRAKKRSKQFNVAVLEETLPEVQPLTADLLDLHESKVVEEVVKTKQPQHKRVKSSKGRQHALKKEMQQMKMVYSNKRFHFDPISALREHLQNSKQ